MEDFTENDEVVWAKVLEKVLEEGSSVDVSLELQNAKKELEEQKVVQELDGTSEGKELEVAVDEVTSAGVAPKRPRDDDAENS